MRQAQNTVPGPRAGIHQNAVEAHVRRYQPADLDALYDVCLRTGDSGADATDDYRDGRLLGHLYAAPYGVLEPERAFVLEDGQGVSGYIVGALDTLLFHRRVREAWLPALRQRYTEPQGARESWSQDERVIARFHHPEVAFPMSLPLELARHPSHLHIDLLPRAQGQGYGGRLMEVFLAELRRQGAPGVHLGVDVDNARAIAFYRRLGFHDAFREHDGRALVMTLSLT